MNPIVKNILAVIVGVVVSSVVNLSIIGIGTSIIPPPEGADMTTMDGMKVAMPAMESKHFVFPFIGHAFGTLVGAFLAALIAANNKMTFAVCIGIFYLVGGIYMVYELPSPAWFAALDLIGAYLPMGYLGGKLATRRQ